VTVIAPGLTPTLAALAETHEVLHHGRYYRTGDLAGAFLAVAATDDGVVQRAVASEAEAERVLLNVVDEPALCGFILPAVVERGSVTVAISTGGSSPALARKMREQLAEQIGQEYGVLADLLGRLRGRVAASLERQEMLGRLVDSPALSWLRDGRFEDVDRLLAEIVDADCSLAGLGVPLTPRTTGI
jgi:precorrin-2 dehydrogenase/sirohydrochlorin ferrochelatase